MRPSPVRETVRGEDDPRRLADVQAGCRPRRHLHAKSRLRAYHGAMLRGRRPWQEELEIIDRTMRAISGVSDPDELVDVYWNGIGELLPINDYVSVSRRN